MSKWINKYSEDTIGKIIILAFMCPSYLIVQAIPKHSVWQLMLTGPRRPWDMGTWACLLGWSWLLIDVGQPTHFSRPIFYLRFWTAYMEKGRRCLHASIACCFLTVEVLWPAASASGHWLPWGWLWPWTMICNKPFLPVLSFVKRCVYHINKTSN